ncbi:enoyl-CoA hydratase/isomerase family protein [Falsigemmobacter intermedius]|uniref:enoyl-CoA hydratase/isomerase family protein n=1 Tax=Falsigemmobacter intermedius TaxID=1553448 RepID=UPI003F041A31
MSKDLRASVTTERRGNVVIIRFAAPPEGYMFPETEPQLEAALDFVEGEAGLSAVILTGGDPGVFIRHFSLEVLHQRAEKLRAKGAEFDLSRPVPEPSLHRAMRRIETSPLPFIAAINGYCMGGGYELALACDIRLAEPGDYHIGLPEVRAGILPGAGGTQRLKSLIGEAAALEMILTGTTFPPQEAAARGLVSRVTQGPVLEEALALADLLAALNPAALAAAKQLVRGSGPDPELMAAERTLFAKVMVSDAAAARLKDLSAGGDIRAIPPATTFTSGDLS